jgi:hypothetical protein
MGLREGDLIVSVDDEEVRSGRELTREIEDQDPGDEVELEIVRNGERRKLKGKLQSREEAFEHRDRQRNRSFARDSRRSWTDEGGFTSSSNYQDSRQDLRSELQRLERQVAQVQRELDNLRYAIDGRSGQDRWSDDRRDRSSQTYYRGESNVRYDDDGSGRRMNQQTNFNRWEGQRDRRGSTSDIHRSSGGEIGEDRQRVGSGEIDRDW